MLAGGRLLGSDVGQQVVSIRITGAGRDAVAVDGSWQSETAV